MAPRRTTYRPLALALFVAWTIGPTVVCAAQRAATRGALCSSSVGTWVGPALDVARLSREDDENASRPGVPRRIGFPVAVDLSPANAGSWETTESGDRRWRLRLINPGALWIVLGLSAFDLEPGARLFVRGDREMLGPFTVDDEREHGQLWFPPIHGDTVVLELEWPASLAGVEPRLRLGTVSHGYKSWDDPLGSPVGGGGRGGVSADSAGACNVDVNCPAGDAWQDEKRGVVQLLSSGSAFCTGSLVNTTAADCRPYLLTAAHCGAGPSTTFRFNYERPGCESGSPRTDQTLTGARVLASYGASDFTLLELDDAIPAGYAVHFNGWQRANQAPPRSWAIHHPSGDVKKISYNDDPLTSGQYWGSSHWRVGNWEVGTTEGGSSGSPLFDPSGRIVGQLHGGTASCSSAGWDEYGKLSTSWIGGGNSATRLEDWLDPLVLGALAWDGLDATVCAAPEPEIVPGEPSAPGGVPLLIGVAAEGYVLSWSAPSAGGPAQDYRLYSYDLMGPWSEPRCEGSLGASTSAVVSELPAGRGFVVVARNASGEGSYGETSSGAARARATLPCP